MPVGYRSYPQASDAPLSWRDSRSQKGHTKREEREGGRKGKGGVGGNKRKEGREQKKRCKGGRVEGRKREKEGGVVKENQVLSHKFTS